VRAGHLLRWVAPLCVFRRGNSGFGGWGTSQYHLSPVIILCFIADLLFLSEVPHSHLVAAPPPPPRAPLFGVWGNAIGEMGPAAVATFPRRPSQAPLHVLTVLHSALYTALCCSPIGSLATTTTCQLPVASCQFLKSPSSWYFYTPHPRSLQPAYLPPFSYPCYLASRTPQGS
jgi:hypothetical protein